MSASNAAMMIISIVRNIGVIPRISRPICTSRVEIFAIVATLIRPRYKLNGTCTKSLSHCFPSFSPNFTLFAIMINITKNAIMMSTERNTC